MDLHAPPGWTCLDFISDLHLHPSDPATFQTWQAYMQRTRADAVVVLGDLFEVWVGDDTLDQGASFALDCVELMRACAQHRSLYLMCGNRDFLMGQRLAAACGAHALPDPTCLHFAGQAWVLSHGDALCLDDTPYLEFRRMVRSPQWQDAFLAKPYAERQQIAQGLRQQSEARKQSGVPYADLDPGAVTALLQQSGAHTLIHGHTHRPGSHRWIDASGQTLQREVLSDWDGQAAPARAQVLRLERSATGELRMLRLSPADCGA